MSSYLQFYVMGCHFIRVGGDGGGGRVTVGVVFINSLLSSSAIFSYWSDISQGVLRKIFTACKWLIIIDYEPHKYSLKYFNLVKIN